MNQKTERLKTDKRNYFVFFRDMPALCLKRNVAMNFEYILSFKTFLSGTVKCHETQRRGGERLKKEREIGV
jgi:hypothetical protein